MSSIQLIARQGAILPPRLRMTPAISMTWRELCAVNAKPAFMALEQDGFASLMGGTVTDHTYSTRPGSSSCSPPV
jgi:hypothetical protein